MSSEIVEQTVRSPDCYMTARRAINDMEAKCVWPTPLNYELWLHRISDPQGELALELDRYLSEGAELSEQTSEDLAFRFLPRHKLSDEIREAGNRLTHQLESITTAIGVAQKSNEAYGRILTHAVGEMESEQIGTNLQRLLGHLRDATQRVQRENGSLEKRLAGSTQEVRRLREHLERVRREAMTDALTNLPNRKAFDEALERACTDEDQGGALTLAILDIDHFKRFNDTWGHQTGDQVLRYVASLLGQTGAAPRMAARYGGEEFAILFPRETAAQAGLALEAARAGVSARMLKRRSTNEDLGIVTISGGYAERCPGESAMLLMERADTALYLSKNGGRNRLTDAARTCIAEDQPLPRVASA